MKRYFATLLMLISAVLALQAQDRIKGKYYPDPNIPGFGATDTNIVVQPFFYGPLAPFMIKGKNPFNSWENKVGFIDTTGKIIVQPKYAGCSYFAGQYASVWRFEGKRQLFGIINPNGKEVVPSIYDYVNPCPNGLFFLYKNRQVALVTARGDTLIPFGKYTHVASDQPVYNEGDDVGHPEFRWIVYQLKFLRFTDYIGVKAANKWAIIDRLGKEVVPPKFDLIHTFKWGLAPIKIDQKWGIANTKGNILIPPLYDDVKIDSSVVYVKNGDKNGLLSITNKLLIPVLYQYVYKVTMGYEARNFSEQVALFGYDGNQVSSFGYRNHNYEYPSWGWRGEYYVYSKTSKKYTRYTDMSSLTDRYSDTRKLYYGYQKNTKWGLIDSIGNEITPPLFDEINHNKINYLLPGSSILFAVKKNNKWGVINSKGKTLLSCAYDDLMPAMGKLIVKRNGHYGLLNNHFKKLTPIRYDSLVTTHPEDVYNPNYKTPVFTRARIDNKWGMINDTGKEAVPFKYDQVFYVYRNLCVVKNKEKFGVVSINGKQIADCLYDGVFMSKDARSSVPEYNGQFTVQKDGLLGLIDSTGFKVAEPIYQNIIQLRNSYLGKYKIKQNNKFGLLDGTTGKVVIAYEYDDLVAPAYGYEQYARQQPEIQLPYVVVRRGNYFGLIDINGKTFLPFEFRSISPFGTEYYLVEKGYQRGGLLDKNFKEIIPAEYKDISVLTKDLFLIRNKYGEGVINRQGQLIADTETYDKVISVCGNKIIIAKGQKVGVLDLSGKVVEDFIYSRITCKDGALIKTP